MRLLKEVWWLADLGPDVWYTECVDSNNNSNNSSNNDSSNDNNDANNMMVMVMIMVVVMCVREIIMIQC